MIPRRPGGHRGRADRVLPAGLPSFKRPRKVVFVGGYPTTATGKIRRVELRQMAATVLTEDTMLTGEP